MADGAPADAGPTTGTTLHDPRIDVATTLEYTSKRHLLILPLGVIALAVGFINVTFGEWGTELALSGWAALACGVVILGMALFRVVQPEKAILELSPRGLIYRNISQNLVPWTQILKVEQRDHTVSWRREPMTFEDATVVWVTEAFYEQVLHVRSLFWRGPNWDNNFIWEEPLVGMVIIPDVVAVPGKELHPEIAARWAAFREQPETGSVPRAGVLRRVGRRRTRTGSVLRTAPVGVALAGLAVIAALVVATNQTGVWQTEGQREARREREAWARKQAEWEREAKERREASERFNRQMDEAFRRMGLGGHAQPAAPEPPRRAPTVPQGAPAPQGAPSPQSPPATPTPGGQAALPPPARPPAPSPPSPARVQGHREAVLWLSVGPDGKSFASASGDRSIKLWNTGGATVVRDLGIHGKIVRAVHILPDGAATLSGSDDGEIALRSVADGTLRHAFQTAEHGDLSALAVSRDGQSAVSVHESGAILVLDLEAKAVRQVMNRGGMPQRAVAVAPDGRRALTGGSDGVARLWDLETGALLKSFAGHQDPVYSVAFTPDGWRAVTGGGDAVLRLWDLDSGREVRRFDGHARTVYAVAVSPDGLRVVTGSIDGTARVWDTTTGAELLKIAGHRGAVYAVAFAGDGLILTGGDDRTIRVWRPNGVEQMRFFGAVE